MSPFIYFEDRNFETGHGWRDRPLDSLKFKFPLDRKDRDLVVDVQSCWVYTACSYFWICPKAYYDEHGHLEDNIRTGHIKEVHPEFKGVDTMESHFEFQRMNPEEARAHLDSLGMVCGGTWKEWGVVVEAETSKE